MKVSFNYRDAIADAMRKAMLFSNKTIIFGLGVTDHIGVFGTTKGLQDEFGSERVFETPISEDAMTGFALGASLSGLYPIYIHIRNDFMLLSMNQLINSIAKYKYMYGGLFEAPMLIRSIIGRSWGQGAQHSQSLQSLFSHSPGLHVVMPASAQSARETYRYAVESCRGPVISLEHRLLYNYSFADSEEYKNIVNPLSSYVVRRGSDITIVATSIMVQEAIRAADYMAHNDNISVEIIDLHCITSPDENIILDSIKKTGLLIVADTSWASYGVCSEVARIVSCNAPYLLKKPIVTLSVAKSPCPTAKKLENYFYPGMSDIVKKINFLCYGSEEHQNESLPEAHIETVDKGFKGPF